MDKSEPPDETLESAILADATRIQKHPRFVGTESKLESQCGKTKTRYKKPPPHEVSRNLRTKRRRKIRKDLAKSLDVETLKAETKKRQSDPRFKRAEFKLRRECNFTRGRKRVKYIPPAPTEQPHETNTRRQKVRRALKRNCQYIAMCFATIHVYALSQTHRMARHLISESISVSCPLGPKRCPCRGINWDHFIFNCDWTKENEEEKLDEYKEFWGTCYMCHNKYDTRLIGQIDVLVGYCEKYMSTLISKDEDMVDVDKIAISAAELEVTLVPKIHSLFGMNKSSSSVDDNVSKAKENINEWVENKLSQHKALMNSTSTEHDIALLRDTLAKSSASAQTSRPLSPINLAHYGFQEPDEEECHLNGDVGGSNEGGANTDGSRAKERVWKRIDEITEIN